MSRVRPTSIRRQVFISYRHADAPGRRQLIEDLRDDLRARGFDVQVDLDLGPSDDWDTMIRTWMHSCDIGVMVLSDDIDSSEYVAMEGQALLDRWWAHDIEAVVPVYVEPLTVDAVTTEDRWAPLRLRRVTAVQAFPPPEPGDDRPLTARVADHLRQEMATTDDLAGRRAHLLRPTIEAAPDLTCVDLRTALGLLAHASPRAIARRVCALPLRDDPAIETGLRAAVRPLALAVDDDCREEVRALARMQWVDEVRAGRVLDEVEVRARPAHPPTAPLSGRGLDEVQGRCIVEAASLLFNPNRYGYVTYVQVVPLTQHGPLGPDARAHLETEVRVAIVNTIHRTGPDRRRQEQAELARAEARARGEAATTELDLRLTRRAADGEPIVAHVLSPEGHDAEDLAAVQDRLPGVTLLASAETPIADLEDCGLAGDEDQWLRLALTFLDFAIDEAS